MSTCVALPSRSCSSASPSPPAADGEKGTSGDDGAEPTTLTVYAAASLTTTFEQIGEEFEAEHDGVEVEFSFGGSSDLVAQIQEGAPADVFASADVANMDKLTAEGLEGQEPAGLRHQHPPDRGGPGQPARDRVGLSDLTGKDVKLVVCAPEVPVRCRGAEGGRGGRGGADPGQRGAVGHRRARQGHRRARRTPGWSTSPT